MNAIGHGFFGALVYLLAVKFGLASFSVSTLVFVGFASALLDLDHLPDLIKRRREIPKYSSIIKFLLHSESRSALFHSITGLAAINALALSLSSQIRFLCLMICLSHIFLDVLDNCCTPIFWPFRKEPHRGPLKLMDSKLSYALTLLFLFLDIALARPLIFK